jgi:hypothetical protein
MYYGPRQQYCTHKRRYYSIGKAFEEIDRLRLTKGEAEVEGLRPYPCPDNGRMSEMDHWHLGHIETRSKREIRSTSQPELLRHRGESPNFSGLAERGSPEGYPDVRDASDCWA